MSASRQPRPPAEDRTLTSDEEELYRLLIDRPNTTAQSLASALHLRPDVVRARLDALEAKGFASRGLDRPVRWGPRHPEAAFAAVLDAKQRDLERLRELAGTLAHRYRKAGVADVPADQLEVVRGSDQIDHRIRQLFRDAEREIVEFDLPPYDAPATDRPLTEHDLRFQIDLLRRGIANRVLYDRTALDFPGVLGLVSVLAGHGQQARVAADLPTKLMVVDARIAVMPLYEEDPLGGIVVAYAAPLVSCLVQLFERAWTTAEDFAPTATSAEAGADVDEFDRKLLRLLALGMKNRAVARQLGISERTVERRSQQILENLGAETRFQAGCIAVRRGLV